MHCVKTYSHTDVSMVGVYMRIICKGVHRTQSLVIVFMCIPNTVHHPSHPNLYFVCTIHSGRYKQRPKQRVIDPSIWCAVCIGKPHTECMQYIQKFSLVCMYRHCKRHNPRLWRSLIISTIWPGCCYYRQPTREGNNTSTNTHTHAHNVHSY